MRAYIIRRTLLIIPTLFLITLMVFLLVRFIPGSALDLMLSQMSEASGGGPGELTIEYIRHAMGLDVPIQTQYGRWLGVWPQASGRLSGLLQGNLGYSLWRTAEPVSDEILGRVPVTLELGLLALVIAWLIALPVGIYSAIRQDTWGDYGGRSFALFWVAAPGFWIATMIMVYPSIWWSWTPPMEYIPLVKDLPGNLLQFIIPAFIMGAAMSGTGARYTRTMMLEVLRQDYIRTAWSKGLTEQTVILRHAMKNALIPVVTILGVEVAAVLSGSVIMENIFNLPGIGRLFFQALTQRDYPVISGINLVLASSVLIMNLLVDITYAYLDPRIRYK